MAKNILIVEDEEAVQNMLGYALIKAGFHCEIVASVEEAKAIVSNNRFDLMLIDWMLPDMDGIDYVRYLRARDETRDVAIIMLTAKGEEADKINGLERGADDYITKPFSIKELIARIKAVLRRGNTKSKEAEQVIEIAGMRLDVGSHRITAQGEPLQLSPTEFKLLHFFITHRERVYSRKQLLDQVWGDNIYIEERAIDVHIRRLRKVLNPFQCAHFIQTVRGFGYRFSTLNT